MERRSTAAYYPGWLRLAQPVRAAMPAVVTKATRHYLPRIEKRSPLHHTDLLGGGGTADAKAAGLS